MWPFPCVRLPSVSVRVCCHTTLSGLASDIVRRSSSFIPIFPVLENRRMVDLTCCLAWFFNATGMYS